MADRPAGNPFVSAVRVEGGQDVADRHIAEHAEPGDVAVTADIPLAARLVEKKSRDRPARATNTPKRTSASVSPCATSWTA